MTRRIQLTRYAAETTNFNNYGAYRLKVEVTAVEGEDLDEYIFVYKREPPSAYTEKNCDTFKAVAGPAQLADYPAGEPNPDQGWPYYRLNYIEVDVPSSAQAEAIWNEIKEEVCILIEAMDRLDVLKVVEEIWCPGPPADTSSQSESTSV